MSRTLYPFSLMALFLLLVSSSPVQAETKVEIRQEVKSNRDNVKTFIQSSTETTVATSSQKLRKELEDKRQEIQRQVQDKVNQVRLNTRAGVAETHANRLEQRFSHYEVRLASISAKIQQRIDTRETAGSDVTEAQTALNKSKTTLAQAVSDGKKAVQAFRDISGTEWEQQRDDVKAAIALAQQARKGFVDARKLMIDAVRALQ